MIGQGVSEEKIFEIVDGQMDGSGELIKEDRNYIKHLMYICHMQQIRF